MNVYQAPLEMALEGLIRTGPVGARVLDGPDPEQLEAVWGPRGLLPEPLVVIDPTGKPGPGITPRDHIQLLFTRKPNQDWTAWLRKHKLKPDVKPDLTADQIRGLLQRGAFGQQLTPEAAGFVAEVLLKDRPGMIFAIAFTLQHLQGPGPAGPLTLDQIMHLWPVGEVRLAADLARELGRPASVRLAAQIPTGERLFGLWRYLEIVCAGSRPEHLHALQAFRNACDRKVLDYRRGLQLFVYHCYRETPWPSNSTRTATSGSRPRTTPSRALYRSCGISS